MYSSARERQRIPQGSRRGQDWSLFRHTALAHALKDKSNKTILFPLPTPSNKNNELDKQTASISNTGSAGGRSDKPPRSLGTLKMSQSMSCRPVVSSAWLRKARRVSGGAAKGKSGGETLLVCLPSPASQPERKALHFSLLRWN